jgi:protein-disulfide isomerase
MLNGALGVLSLCAVVITTLVVRREFFPPTPGDNAAIETEIVPSWRDYTRDGHRVGSATAPVTIVYFSDFQCPFCATLAERLKTLQRKYPNELAVVYRHYPLAGHPHALAAARASECAAAAGRFFPFHDVLFEHADSIGQRPWVEFARAAGVRDTVTFNRCTRARGSVPAITRDSAAGNRLKVTSTPTLLINDTRIVGALPLDALDKYVRRALESASRQSDAGDRPIVGG